MCIDAALAEDDFETAYSYIMTRLVTIAAPAQERTPQPDRKGGLFAELPPKEIDDWSWRAALQAGKYRRTSQTVQPTHLGNASGNPDIRHLEQRMDCLSHAVRLAPKSTLQEILNGMYSNFFLKAFVSFQQFLKAINLLPFSGWLRLSDCGRQNSGPPSFLHLH